MFQFARFAHTHLFYSVGCFWVAPFGHLRLVARFQLPGVYRRSPRPSSPLCAKVSTVSPFYLDHLFLFFREFLFVSELLNTKTFPGFLFPVLVSFFDPF